jgi:phosphatidate phosphatase APP1
MRFMDEAGFPAGGYHLRNVWTRGNTRFDLSDSGVESYKFAPIKTVLALHPGRAFILVGDSGEKDPEVYAQVARLNPGRIKHIYIRRAPHADESAARYEAAFRGLPRTLWSTFTDPLVP